MSEDPRPTLRRVVVVEGPSDVSAVRRAVNATVIATGGHHFRPDLLTTLREAHERVGIVVLTDPDRAGEAIRARISAAVPSAGHARVARADCTHNGRSGVEYAAPDVVRRALSCVAEGPTAEPYDWSPAELRALGLVGHPDAAARRAIVSAAFRLGHVDGRQLLRRLRAFGVRPDEVRASLETART